MDGGDEAPGAWDDAVLAAALFAIDPLGTGLVLRAPAGAVRERWLGLLQRWTHGLATQRLPLHTGDERLLGGLDLAATLRAGRPVAQRGVLAAADGGVLVVAMAERLEAAATARLCAAIDRHEVVAERDGLALRHPARFGSVLLDEGAADDERPPAALRDRLALHIDLNPVLPREALAPGDAPSWPQPDEIAAARSRLGAGVPVPDALLQALCEACAALGIASVRAVLGAVAVARAHAALLGDDEVDSHSVQVAARLVLGPRATMLPVAAQAPDDVADDLPADAAAPPDDDSGAPDAPDAPGATHTTDATDPAPPPEVEPPADVDPAEAPDAEAAGQLGEIVLEAALASLPVDLLRRLKQGSGEVRTAGAAGTAGAAQPPRGNATRGRPVGVRRAAPGGGMRLHLVETLRAAAPWQRLRREQQAGAAARGKVLVLPDDFRVTLRRQPRQTTTVFAVDASGSSALHRLAEAKGAVELLLADCYVRRDSVAVIAFRGRSAELLLPPTRSLVRARRALAGMPGGGGTPLAAALEAVTALSAASRRRGDTPLVVLLTDGRANVSLDGTGGRERATADALGAAARFRASGTGAIVIDTARVPSPAAARLAQAMGATHLPLPLAGAVAVSQAVQAAQLARSKR